VHSFNSEFVSSEPADLLTAKGIVPEHGALVDSQPADLDCQAELLIADVWPLRPRSFSRA
jgi:hypothetical protein